MSEELKAMRLGLTKADITYLARNMSGIPMSEWNAISNRMLDTAERLAETEAKVRQLQTIIDSVVANCEASASSYQERIETIHRVTSALALEWAEDSTLKGAPDGR